MMRRLIALLCLLGVSLVCIFCAPARVQRFLERSVLSAYQVDSLLCAHSLPPLDSWAGAAQYTVSGAKIPQWRYIERFKESDTVEMVHVVEARDTVYLYVCRAVLRSSR